MKFAKFCISTCLIVFCVRSTCAFVASLLNNLSQFLRCAENLIEICITNWPWMSQFLYSSFSSYLWLNSNSYYFVFLQIWFMIWTLVWQSIGDFVTRSLLNSRLWDIIEFLHIFVWLMVHRFIEFIKISPFYPQFIIIQVLFFVLLYLLLYFLCCHKILKYILKIEIGIHIKKREKKEVKS